MQRLYFSGKYYFAFYFGFDPYTFFGIFKTSLWLLNSKPVLIYLDLIHYNGLAACIIWDIAGSVTILPLVYIQPSNMEMFHCHDTEMNRNRMLIGRDFDFTWSSPHRLILALTWVFDKVSKVSGVWVEQRHTIISTVFSITILILQCVQNVPCTVFQKWRLVIWRWKIQIKKKPYHCEL